jgi:hypothetical protein
LIAAALVERPYKAAILSQNARISVKTTPFQRTSAKVETVLTLNTPQVMPDRVARV